MRLMITTFLLLFLLSGCSAYSSKNVALMPFSSPVNKNVGQETSDRLAQELVAKGYVVIDRSITSNWVNEASFYSSGLSDEMRQKLKAHNLAAVVYGNINDFRCDSINSSGSLYSKSLVRCTVSVTAKMTDLVTGRLLWGMTMNDTDEGENLTAMGLMNTMIQKANIIAGIPEPAGQTKQYAQN